MICDRAAVRDADLLHEEIRVTNVIFHIFHLASHFARKRNAHIREHYFKVVPILFASDEVEEAAVGS